MVRVCALVDTMTDWNTVACDYPDERHYHSFITPLPNYHMTSVLR